MFRPRIWRLHPFRFLLTRSAALSLAFQGGGRKALLRVNPEPSTRAQAEGQAPAFMPGSRRVYTLFLVSYTSIETEVLCDSPNLIEWKKTQIEKGSHVDEITIC
jgi:hypothetical protein